MLNVIYFPEGDFIIGQCLEYDLVGYGYTHEEAEASIIRVIEGQIYLDIRDKKLIFQGCSPAPEEYREMFLNGDEKIKRRVYEFKIHRVYQMF